MKTRHVITALAAAAMTLQLLGGPASAQTPPALDFSFLPTTGTAGTPIAYQGTGCTHDANRPHDGVFILTKDGTTGAQDTFVSNASGAFTGEYDTTGLTPGVYTTIVTCVSTGVSGIGSPFTVTVPPPPPGSPYHPTAPSRILDTRSGVGIGGTPNAIGPAGVIDLQVTGAAGVPAGAKAVALNVTATNASGPSHLTVWPKGSVQPDASNLNFSSGVSVPNLVIAQLGTDGKVSIRNNQGTVHVVADVQGWYSNTGDPGSRYVPIDPQRILDTREGLGAPQAQVGADGVIELAVTGVANVPANAAAVVLNMTVDQATGPEAFLTVWPSGNSMPTASNLNFTGGPATTNLVIARVGAGGKVAIYNSQGATDVIADVQGWFTAPAATNGSTYFGTNPVRILDSRNGTGTPGGASGQRGNYATIDLAVAGVSGVPATGVTSVVLNVTVADSPGPDSFLTLFPSGTARQVTSNLNYSAGETVANLVIARVNNGKVAIYNHHGSTNVIADVQGWFSG